MGNHAYLQRAGQFLDLCEKHEVLSDHKEFLELGTGWTHWHAIFLRLHFDSKFTLFDVWDNRQFHNLTTSFSKLREEASELSLSKQFDAKLLDQLLDTSSFDELYELLNFEYLIRDDGRLTDIPPSKIDCVFSSDVLEHVPEQHYKTCVEDMFQILKPGGYALNYIACDDHLAHYDKNATPKTYLEHSNDAWKRYYQNDIQYFNRLQRSDWLSAFEAAGFELVEQRSTSTDIQHLSVDKDFDHYDTEDLECVSLLVLHRKPA